MQGGLIHERNVRPSVCLSIKRVNCDKTKETCDDILIPHERPFILVFLCWQEEWLVGIDRTANVLLLLLRNFGSNWPRWSENANFQSIFGRSASAVTPMEKNQLTLIGSLLRAFQSRQDEHCTLPLSPQRELRIKFHFTWRKFATKFLCINTVSDKVVRHSLSYLSVQKWFAEDVSYYVEICANWPTPLKLKNADFHSFYAHRASACSAVSLDSWATCKFKGLKDNATKSLYKYRPYLSTWTVVCITS